MPQAVNEPIRLRPTKANAFITGMMRQAENAMANNGVPRDDGKAGKGGLANFSAKRSGDIMRVNPYLIYFQENWNIRDLSDASNRAHIIRLAHDMAARGFMTTKPLEVFWSRADRKIYVIDGHCRALAVWYANEYLGAKIELITVITAGVPEDAVAQMAKTFTANGGKNPSILEKAAQFRKMMEVSGQDHVVNAARIGEDPNTVMEWMKAESLLSPPIRKLIIDGRVSLSAAVQSIEANGFKTDKALVEITQGMKIAAETGAKDGMVKPRHIQHARLGAKLPPLKTGLRKMLESNRISVHQQDGKVVMAMDPVVYGQLCGMLGIDAADFAEDEVSPKSLAA